MVPIEDVNKVQEFINLYLPEPSLELAKDEFDTYSYSRWIAQTILYSLYEYTEQSPFSCCNRELVTTKDILYSIEAYFDSLASINGEKQGVFIIALDTIHKIINFLIKGEIDDLG